MKIKRLALCGILTAIALTIFVLESYLPPLTAIPGIKLGLSNIITLFALAFLTPKEALLILITRIVLGAFFIGNPSVLLYSLSGGILCLLAEWVLLKVSGARFLWGISAIGAIVHNTVQLFIALLITRTSALLWYLPYLWIAGLITGLFTGFCVWYIARKCPDPVKKFLNQ